MEDVFSIVELLDFDFSAEADIVDCAVEDADDIKGLLDLLPRIERLLLVLLIGTELPELPLPTLGCSSLAALSLSLTLSSPPLR